MNVVFLLAGIAAATAIPAAAQGSSCTMVDGQLITRSSPPSWPYQVYAPVYNRACNSTPGHIYPATSADDAASALCWLPVKIAQNTFAN